MTSAETMASFGMEALTPVLALVRIALLEFILPMLLTYAIYLLIRKIGWIKDGDMVIESAKKAK